MTEEGLHSEQRHGDQHIEFLLGTLSTGVNNLVTGQARIETSISGIHKRIDFAEHKQQADDRDVRGLIAVVSTSAAISKTKLAGFVFIASLIASAIVAAVVKNFFGGMP